MTEEIKLTDIKKILVRSPNWLGDCVMAIPAIRELKKKFPDAEIYVQAKKSVSIIYEWVAEVTDVLEFPDGKAWQNLSEKNEHAAKCLKYNFDLGVLLTNSFSTAFWMWKSGVKRIAGTDVSCRGIFLTDKIALTEKIKEAHQAEWYLAVLEPFGIKAELTTPSLDKELNSGEEMFLSQYKEPYIILAPGSAYGPAKDWLAENFALLAEKLNNEKFKIVITGSASDRKSAEKISTASSAEIIDLTGRTSMNEFLLLLKNASGFVGNDSGASHCAAAFGIPTVAVFGSTRPDRTRPLGEKVTYLSGTADCIPCMRRTCFQTGEKFMQCMKTVSPDDVFDGLKKLGVFSKVSSEQ
ncbi:MAG: lipopolysaccharide heptosyltransferase II [Planctomycetota bacterium]